MINQGRGLLNTLTISIKKGQKYNGSPECANDLLWCTRDQRNKCLSVCICICILGIFVYFHQFQALVLGTSSPAGAQPGICGKPRRTALRLNLWNFALNIEGSCEDFGYRNRPSCKSMNFHQRFSLVTRLAELPEECKIWSFIIT